MSRRINREGPAALRGLARRSLLGLVAVSTAATICVLPVTPAAAAVNPLGVPLAAAPAVATEPAVPVRDFLSGRSSGTGVPHTACPGAGSGPARPGGRPGSRRGRGDAQPRAGAGTDLPHRHRRRHLAGHGRGDREGHADDDPGQRPHRAGPGHPDVRRRRRLHRLRRRRSRRARGRREGQHRHTGAGQQADHPVRPELGGVRRSENSTCPPASPCSSSTSRRAR